MDEQSKDAIKGDVVMRKHDKNEPSRPLSTNFTDRTLRRAIKAKRRETRWLPLKELLHMKKRTMIRQPVGALIALAIVILGGAGVYAAANWFGGAVKVTSDDSIMTVDLTKCDSNLPPGVEPTSDRANIKFKITGSPHISAEELQRKLLVNCEFDSVLKFYQSKIGAMVGTPPAVVKAVNSSEKKITFSIRWGGEDIERTFVLAKDAQIIDKGATSDLTALRPGDYVMFAYKFDEGLIVNETDNPFDYVKEVLGVFKTQYDTREFLESAKSLYSANNIMPLDWYNQIHKK